MNNHEELRSAMLTMALLFIGHSLWARLFDTGGTVEGVFQNIVVAIVGGPFLLLALGMLAAIAIRHRSS